jgi:hypothetical protein
LHRFDDESAVTVRLYGKEKGPNKRHASGDIAYYSDDTGDECPPRKSLRVRVHYI